MGATISGVVVRPMSQDRARSIESIVSPSHLVRGLVRALRKPGADLGAIMREVLHELPLEWQARRHRLIDA
jgi:hypothetical protein